MDTGLFLGILAIISGFIYWWFKPENVRAWFLRMFKRGPKTVESLPQESPNKPAPYRMSSIRADGDPVTNKIIQKRMRRIFNDSSNFERYL